MLHHSQIESKADNKNCCKRWLWMIFPLSQRQLFSSASQAPVMASSRHPIMNAPKVCETPLPLNAVPEVSTCISNKGAERVLYLSKKCQQKRLTFRDVNRSTDKIHCFGKDFNCCDQRDKRAKPKQAWVFTI